MLCAPPVDIMNFTRMTSGSTTSLVLPFPHQSNVQTEPRHGGEIVARDCREQAVGSGLYISAGEHRDGSASAAGSGASAGDNPGQQSLSPHGSIWTSGSLNSHRITASQR